ncbi:hypothetical protein ABT369_39530 [Dactylosporangium sp. NPDC000244]|uniref:hypothetical protein n=1 Tax=Dactylosporangium sp. NPDC000244 TaxID=3154365 RepID=UPI00331E9E85
MTSHDPITAVELPLPWGATLRLFPDGTVTLLTSEDEAALTDENLDGIADLVARARQIRSKGE